MILSLVEAATKKLKGGTTIRAYRASIGWFTWPATKFRECINGISNAAAMSVLPKRSKKREMGV